MKNNRRLKFEKKNLRRKNEIIRQNSKKVNDSPKPLNEVHIVNGFFDLYIFIDWCIKIEKIDNLITKNR